MNGARNGTIVWPRPQGLWGGAERSNIIQFQLLSQFLFFNQTACVFSQMIDIKHIRRELHSVARYASGVGLGGYRRGVGLGSKKSASQLNLVCELLI